MNKVYSIKLCIELIRSQRFSTYLSIFPFHKKAENRNIWRQKWDCWTCEYGTRLCHRKSSSSSKYACIFSQSIAKLWPRFIDAIPYILCAVYEQTTMEKYWQQPQPYLACDDDNAEISPLEFTKHDRMSYRVRNCERMKNQQWSTCVRESKKILSACRLLDGEYMLHKSLNSMFLHKKKRTSLMCATTSFAS